MSGGNIKHILLSTIYIYSLSLPLPCYSQNHNQLLKHLLLKSFLIRFLFMVLKLETKKETNFFWLKLLGSALVDLSLVESDTM